jgi:cathepsin L
MSPSSITRFLTDSEHQVTSKYAVFRKNLALIKRHNEEFRAGKHTYEVALNEYADLTWEEFSSTRLGLLPAARQRKAPSTHTRSNTTLPAAIDWREKGAVLPAKNQGACGSCWAFSAVCALEGANFLKTGQLTSLSEQQLVDCSKDWSDDTDLDNYGCNGGLMDNAFAYWLNSSHGDDTEASYPYSGRDGKCKFSPAKIGAAISGYKDIPLDDESALHDAVATIGPVSVAIHAGPTLQFYFRGVFNGVLGMCPGPLNHGVTAVGYGTAPATRLRKEMDFWIIKNSWGKVWGEKGFFRLARGKNLCGVAKDASYPVV